MATGFKEIYEVKKMTTDIRVYCKPELKNMLIRLAQKAGLPLSEYVVKLLALSIDKPELSDVPRKPPGRKCKVSA